MSWKAMMAFKACMQGLYEGPKAVVEGFYRLCVESWALEDVPGPEANNCPEGNNGQKSISTQTDPETNNDPEQLESSYRRLLGDTLLEKDEIMGSGEANKESKVPTSQRSHKDSDDVTTHMEPAELKLPTLLSDVIESDLEDAGAEKKDSAKLQMEEQQCKIPMIAGQDKNGSENPRVHKKVSRVKKVRPVASRKEWSSLEDEYEQWKLNIKDGEGKGVVQGASSLGTQQEGDALALLFRILLFHLHVTFQCFKYMTSIPRTAEDPILFHRQYWIKFRPNPHRPQCPDRACWLDMSTSEQKWHLEQWLMSKLSLDMNKEWMLTEYVEDADPIVWNVAKWRQALKNRNEICWIGFRLTQFDFLALVELVMLDYAKLWMRAIFVDDYAK